MKKSIKNPVIWCLVLLSVAPVWAVSSEPNASPVFKQEELDQILAPIALYPDSLLSQILMASTYPLEVVQAERWVKQNKDLSPDALAVALEKQTWDPSVKSLVNFPQILTMMSEKLDLTQKIGDAFLAQQKDVMDTVQKLRNKAQEQGNLKTTKEQVVKVEQGKIAIEPNQSQVIYVPTYDPAQAYGTWSDSAYPPYDYYPPDYYEDYYPYGYGVAVGPAWGYAWGDLDWERGDLGFDFGRNPDINPNIDRGKYAQQLGAAGQLGQGGKGKWQHNPGDRKGVPYRDGATAQKFNRASTPEAVKSREAYRGRDGQATQNLTDSGARARSATAQQGQGGTQNRAATRDMSSQGVGRSATAQQGQRGTQNRAATQSMSSRGSPKQGGALQGMDRGSSAKNASSRGQASRQSMSRPSGGRPGGGMSRPGGGGGGRMGGGGGRR